MFDSDLQVSSFSKNSSNFADLNSQLLAYTKMEADAYGLDVASSSHKGVGSGIPLQGSSLSVGGTLLIQGGNTSTAEINEVNNRLAQSIYQRDTITSNRSYTNYSYNTNDALTQQSANESVGMDRGDYLTNAIDIGTIVYRSSANVTGNIGYNSSGVRDENDYFRFFVGKSGTVNLSLNGLGKDVGLALYDVNFNLVSHSDKAGNSSELISQNLNTGNYFARVYSYAQSPWSHGATSYNLTISRQADALENYWQNLLVDSSVENAALNSIKFDSSLSRTDVIGILQSAGDFGSVTNEELIDLRNFYNNAINTINVDNDLKILSQKVLFTDPSNQWYTGSDSIRATLGNLTSGSSTNHLNLLIGKHFLGTDRPAIHRDTNNNLAGSYTQANGSLFVGGASANDIVQGATGDCYFLAALAGTANDKNSMISNIFRDNGDGTWSVRFFTNGKVDYVTVDRMMPTDNSGRYIYANFGQTVASSNELWVALAEKAYAQINESGRIGQDGTNFYGNGNDNGIGWGSDGAATKHITDLSTTYEKLSSNAANGLNRTELINVVNSNRVVTISGFNHLATNSNAGETNVRTAVQAHAYTITGYNSANDRFTVRNPWGSRHLSLTFEQLLQLGSGVSYSNS